MQLKRDPYTHDITRMDFLSGSTQKMKVANLNKIRIIISDTRSKRNAAGYDMKK